MTSDIDIDEAMRRAERAISPDTAARLKKIDVLIAKLEEQKEKFPFETCQDINKQIAELSGAKDMLRSGRTGVEAKPPQPIVRRSLPVAIDLKDDRDAVVDPLVGLERLPQDPDGHKALSDQLFDFALSNVNGNLADFRKSVLKDKSDLEVQFTQGTYRALILTLAFIYSQMKFTFALARDRRDDVEKRLLARIEELEQRPYIVDAGVWDGTKEYPAGSLVSHAGAMWISKIQTKSCRPGDGPALWRLAAKSYKGGST